MGVIMSDDLNSNGVSKWSDFWDADCSRFRELFANRHSFSCWCSHNFHPKVPSDVSAEEIIALRKKKGAWKGTHYLEVFE